MSLAWALIIATFLLVVGGVVAVTAPRYLKLKHERAKQKRLEWHSKHREDELEQRLEELRHEEALNEQEAKEAHEEYQKNTLAASTREALHYGYTMNQVVKWAYDEVYFEDHTEPKRQNLGTKWSGFHGKHVTNWESKRAARKRVKQQRYERIRDCLLGKEMHPTLTGRNILEALQRAGVRPVSKTFLGRIKAWGK